MICPYALMEILEPRLLASASVPAPLASALAVSAFPATTLATPATSAMSLAPLEALSAPVRLTDLLSSILPVVSKGCFQSLSTAVVTVTPVACESMIAVGDETEPPAGGKPPTRIEGDANLDRTVDIDDFIILKQNFSVGTTWEQGDFDCDGNVDIDDFVLLKQFYGRSI